MFHRGRPQLGCLSSHSVGAGSTTIQRSGGIIKDETRLQGVYVSTEVGAALDIGEDAEPITAGLLLTPWEMVAPLRVSSDLA